MSIDQREPRIGTLGASEFRVRRVGKAFPDGSSFAPGWRVGNDGALITLTQKSILNGDPLNVSQRVPKMADRYPALGGIFQVAKAHYPNAEPYMICTIPTVDTANAFTRAIFAGLPTVGIELVQTTDRDETPVAEYVTHLDNRRLVVGAEKELFLHDVLAHWIGAATTPKDEFAIFQKLVADLDAVGESFGEKTKSQYLMSLGRGFDVHSAFVLMDAHTEPAEKTLPDECLAVITMECPKVLERSTALVAAAGEIDKKKRTAYYQDIRKALQQAPWEPSHTTTRI